LGKDPVVNLWLTAVNRLPIGALALAASFGVAPVSGAMEPPSRQQIERYRLDGSLAARAASARSTGNHLIAPDLAKRVEVGGEAKAGSAAKTKRLPSTGRQRVFALLVGFADYPGRNAPGEIDRRLFGTGSGAEFPYESLRNFYLRSSFGLLELEGVTLGWYTTPYRRSSVDQSDAGREALIREVIGHFDDRGHDFSQYDNNGDGAVDYFLVFYAGPRQEWGDFWWGYQRDFGDGDFRVDGLRLGAYSWQWESSEVGGPFSAVVAIHETGHALGLPDYYDYDDGVGPSGGLGGLDMMDNNWGDHNAFSKFLLGWVEPTAVNEGIQRLTIRASDETGEAVVMMHGDPVNHPFDEYFIAQYRRRSGNDSGYPADGILIWHVDARVAPDGRFLSDNSYTDHKLIRLMEADGLEEIEQNFGADAGDFYGVGDVFSPTTVPDSARYDGTPTGLMVDGIDRGWAAASFDADLGSGCGIFGDVPGPVTGWPGISTPFRAEITAENCSGPTVVKWRFDDGSRATGTAVGHRFLDEGTSTWRLTATASDASFRTTGEVLVCSDPRCYQWRPEGGMRGPRLQHSAVVLGDGRVLVVGGGPEPEIFDPRDGSWRSTAPSAGSFDYASAQLLLDGRVLVTGSALDDPVNAEIYDPASDSWSVTGRMIVDRVMHSSIRLRDGRVLVAGGVFGARRATLAELWDPVTGAWTGTEDIGPEEVPGLALLGDGQVLLVGAERTRIFNPSTLRWRRIADLNHRHTFGSTVVLGDGRVMVVGGEGTAECEIFDPDLNLWRQGPPLSAIRAVPSVVVLPIGHVVAAGGADGRWRIGGSVELLDPLAQRWIEIQPMDGRRLAHTMTALRDGSVLVTGGTTSVLEEPYVGQATAERLLMPVETTPPRNGTGRTGP
jgi:M6 family metalloprotease-like protein